MTHKSKALYENTKRMLEKGNCSGIDCLNCPLHREREKIPVFCTHGLGNPLASFSSENISDLEAHIKSYSPEDIMEAYL